MLFLLMLLTKRIINENNKNIQTTHFVIRSIGHRQYSGSRKFCAFDLKGGKNLL